MASFNKFFPLKTKLVKTKSLAKPYITSEIKALISQKHKLQRKFAKFPLTYGEAFRNLRNLVTSRIRNAKANYFKTRLEQNSGNSKETWKTINTILNRNKNQADHHSFKVNNEVIHDPPKIANISTITL